MGLVSLLSGCAHPVSLPCFEPPVLPTMGRSSFRLDLSALPKDAGPYPADATYQGLTEADCPCLAARASTVGNLLDQKAQASSQRRHRCQLTGEKAGELSRTVLQHAAEEARNRSAGDAIEAFYRLVEAEGRLAYLLLGLKEVNESLKRSEELQAKGLPSPVEISAVRKQLIDLRSDEVNLRIAILQLNARLKVLLGLSCGDYSLWPVADLKVVPEVPDIDEAVDYGLHHRPDLAFLQALADGLDTQSLGVASQALAAVNPLLGEPSSSPFLASLCACLAGGKTQSAEQQVQSLMTERKRQAVEEIRQAVELVAYRVQLVILAQQKVENEERRIKELEEKKAKGLDAEGELSTARLNLYKAQGELLREVVNWKIASAQLRQAQGRLLEECRCTDNVAPGAAPTGNVRCPRTIAERAR
jgi:outer membrane protein TolC